MRASFTNTQMQADTLTGTNTQQVLTGWSPHSQNTDMQIGNLQTERRRWDKDRECTYRTGMGKKSQQMEEWVMIGGWKWERKQQSGREKKGGQRWVIKGWKGLPLNHRAVRNQTPHSITAPLCADDSEFQAGVWKKKWASLCCVTHFTMCVCVSAAQTLRSPNFYITAQKRAAQSHNTGLRAHQ